MANIAGGGISQFTIGADDSLSAMTPATVATGLSPQSIVTVST